VYSDRTEALAFVLGLASWLDRFGRWPTVAEIERLEDDSPPEVNREAVEVPHSAAKRRVADYVCPGFRLVSTVDGGIAPLLPILRRAAALAGVLEGVHGRSLDSASDREAVALSIARALHGSKVARTTREGLSLLAAGVGLTETQRGEWLQAVGALAGVDLEVTS
jgi:hypothetical protein